MNIDAALKETAINSQAQWNKQARNKEAIQLYVTSFFSNFICNFIKNNVSLFVLYICICYLKA